jgi:hypothetical protein
MESMSEGDCLSSKGIHLNNKGKQVLAKMIDQYTTLMELKRTGRMKDEISYNPVHHFDNGHSRGHSTVPKNQQGSVW